MISEELSRERLPYQRVKVHADIRVSVVSPSFAIVHSEFHFLSNDELLSNKCRYSRYCEVPLEQPFLLIKSLLLTIRLWARDFYRVIVDEGAAPVNYHA